MEGLVLAELHRTIPRRRKFRMKGSALNFTENTGIFQISIALYKADGVLTVFVFPTGVLSTYSIQ